MHFFAFQSNFRISPNTWNSSLRVSASVPLMCYRYDGQWQVGKSVLTKVFLLNWRRGQITQINKGSFGALHSGSFIRF